jgi:hypothetical protein
MTDIISFDIRAIIQDSVTELTRHLTDTIEKKIHIDISNAFYESKSKSSIFGFEDDEYFGKSPPGLYFTGGFDPIHGKYISYYNPHNRRDQVTELKFDKHNYPIITIAYRDTSYQGNTHNNAYIMNTINGRKLTNDEIFIIQLCIHKISLSDDVYLFSYGHYSLKTGLEYIMAKYKLGSTDAILDTYFKTVIEYKLKALKYDSIKNITDIEELQTDISELKAEYDVLHDAHEEQLELCKERIKAYKELKIEHTILQESHIALQEKYDTLNTRPDKPYTMDAELQKERYENSLLKIEMQLQKERYENDLLKKEIQLLMSSR